MRIETSELITIERHILDQEQLNPHATGELSRLLYQIAFVGKTISREVRRAGLVEIFGATGDENVHGESVQKLDLIAHDAMIDAFDHTGVLCAMGSEETAGLIPIPPEYNLGKYTLTFDPLDGSSNIDANINIGTIFSVHRKVTRGREGQLEDFLQPGSKQVVAGYVMYGSSTMLVYTTGMGVYGFTLDPTLGEFLLSHPQIKIPPRGKIFSVNMGNYQYWSPGVRKYVDDVMSVDLNRHRPYTSRYIGSLVADIHRTMLYGGIFMYPMDFKDASKPKGKLRLLYEANPISMLIEQAGGIATDGTQRILDIVPTELHQRTPLFIGSKEEVNEVTEYIRHYG